MLETFIGKNGLKGTREKFADINVEMAEARLGAPARLVADASLARNELCWQPEFSSLDMIIKHA